MDPLEKERRGINHRSSPKRETFTRLSLCFLTIGLLCIIVIGGMLTIFLVFMEPCLNPFTSSTNYIFSFNTSDTIISFSVLSSSTVLARSLPPGSPSDRLDTQITLSAISRDQLEEVQVSQQASKNSFSLSFQRPHVLRTLEDCSTEEVGLQFSPYFGNPLNASFQIRRGALEVRSLENLQFQNFHGNVEEGDISIATIACLQAFTAFSGLGDLSFGPLLSSSFEAQTRFGQIFLNGPSSASFKVSSGGGEILATSLIVRNLAAVPCLLDLRTEKGEISIALIDLLTTKTCQISLFTESGSISVALKGFSGGFRASTLKGSIIVPGFEECEGEAFCLGTVNPDGGLNQAIFAETKFGSITLIFV